MHIYIYVYISIYTFTRIYLYFCIRIQHAAVLPLLCELDHGRLAASLLGEEKHHDPVLALVLSLSLLFPFAPDDGSPHLSPVDLWLVRGGFIDFALCALTVPAAPPVGVVRSWGTYHMG